MFALLGAVGSIGALAAAGTGRAREGRFRRRTRRRDAEACTRFGVGLAASATAVRHRAVAEAIERCSLSALRRPWLWTRRASHGDAFRVQIGWGSARCEIPLGVDVATLRPDLRPVVEAASLLRDVPVGVDLAADGGDFHRDRR